MSYISRKSIQKCQEFRSYKNITTTWKTSWQDKEPVPCVLRLVICYPNAHQYTRCTSNGKNHLTFFFCVLSKEFCQTRILMIQCLGMAWPNANITTILDPLFLPPRGADLTGAKEPKRTKNDPKIAQKWFKVFLIWNLDFASDFEPFLGRVFFCLFWPDFSKILGPKWTKNRSQKWPKMDGWIPNLA